MAVSKGLVNCTAAIHRKGQFLGAVWLAHKALQLLQARLRVLRQKRHSLLKKAEAEYAWDLTCAMT